MSEPAFDAIVIGASAGALEALTSLLPGLPGHYAIPLIAVVHLPPDKKSVLAELLQARCTLSVHEAEDKEDIQAGNVYIAPPDYHLQVETNKRLSLSTEEPVLFSRPSIDVLFETASCAYGAGLVGIVLTGASSDGAKGLKAIMDAGGVGIVQRPDTAFASAMPQAAIGLCPDALVLSLAEIADYLQKATL